MLMICVLYQIFPQPLKAFCTANSLTLNSSNTEAVVFAKGSHVQQTITVAGHSIQTAPSLKYLGVWIQQDMSSCKSIEDNIAKARRAFFATGLLCFFPGKCNPLTGRISFEIFVIPVFLYGCESWVLTRETLRNSSPKLANVLQQSCSPNWTSSSVNKS